MVRKVNWVGRFHEGPALSWATTQTALQVAERFGTDSRACAERVFACSKNGSIKEALHNLDQEIKAQRSGYEGLYHSPDKQDYLQRIEALWNVKGVLASELYRLSKDSAMDQRRGT